MEWVGTRGWMPPRWLVAAAPRRLVAAAPRGSRAGAGVHGVGIRGWMPPRRLVAAAPRGSWGGVVCRRAKGWDTRVDAATTAGYRRAAWFLEWLLTLLVQVLVAGPLSTPPLFTS